MVTLNNYNLTEQQWIESYQGQNSSLLFKKISADTLTPVQVFLKIKAQVPDHIFLFESAENDQKKGRFSIIGCLPDLVWKCHKQQAFVNNNFQQNQQDFILQKTSPLQNLRQLIDQSKIDFSRFSYNRESLPSMCSGLFGYMGYDMVRLMEKLPDNNLCDQLTIPDGIFIRPQVILVFDNFYDTLLICAPSYKINENYHHIAKKIELIESYLDHQLPKTSINQLADNFQFNFQASYSKEQFCSMVEKAKEYITQGDVFQVLPSQRFSSDFPEVDDFEFYRALRIVNPSPFLFYLKFPDFTLTGSSPEIMVAKRDKKIIVRPLAGTRKRGKNSKEDQIIAQELLQDQKEIAEHLMLIDLARNDIGAIAKPYSIEVTKKMAIEIYSHVIHISSNVEGELRDDLHALDALISAFPAGTVSGAPKIRAMEIIEEIEKIKRSFYAGCVGYFASNGDMETCITLRSSVIKNKKIYLHSGAGVVFDSCVNSEYQETLNKSQALIEACNQMIKNILQK
jgi:anthranilate synthase component 1